jgi:iron(III) transport system ATP-binding protein
VAQLLLAGLTKRFGDVVAVDQLDLNVPDGALVSLLGPSGCGKTTTLRLIAGFVEPDAGSIVLGGRTISAPGATLPPEHRNMAMIFQSFALWPHMNVAENVGYGLKPRKLSRAEHESRVRAMLATVRLDSMADRYPSDLSGGQQQRVALARALVVAPETLLLDEPLSNLDASLREEMRFEIRRLHEEFRTTSVYVTHDQAEAMTTADLIVVMNHGRVEQAGTPEAIFERPASAFVARFLGGTNILEGQHLGGGVIEGEGFRLHAADAAGLPQGQVACSLRHHAIDLLPRTGAPPQAEDGASLLAARVLRAVYLGATRDVLAQLEPGGHGQGGPTLRLLLPARQEVAAGQAVWLSIPPRACHVLAG